MKNSGRAIVGAGVVVLSVASTLFARPSDFFNLDENGNGTYVSDFMSLTFQFGGPVDASAVLPDPSGGNTNLTSVLVYDLGVPVAGGDVALMEPGQTTAAKLVRFLPVDANDTWVIFYSQPDGTPAGVGIPASTNAVPVIISNGVSMWIPANTNQPGYDLAGAEPIGFTGYGYYFHTVSRTEAVHCFGTNLIWNYSCPFACERFHVVASTNFLAPPTNWVSVATNLFDQTGSYSLTLPVSQGMSRLYYRVVVP